MHTRTVKTVSGRQGRVFAAAVPQASPIHALLIRESYTARIARCCYLAADSLREALLQSRAQEKDELRYALLASPRL